MLSDYKSFRPSTAIIWGQQLGGCFSEEKCLARQRLSRCSRTRRTWLAGRRQNPSRPQQFLQLFLVDIISADPSQARVLSEPGCTILGRYCANTGLHTRLGSFECLHILVLCFEGGWATCFIVMEDCRIIRTSKRLSVAWTNLLFLSSISLLD